MSGIIQEAGTPGVGTSKHPLTPPSDFTRKDSAMAKSRPIPELTPKEIERFWASVEVPDQPSCCWRWVKAKDDRGYGSVSVTRNGKQKFYRAHRVAYTLLIGPIPDGLPLDHLCKTLPCINPDHLEPVEPRINTIRGASPSSRNRIKTHCVNGHEFTPGNTYRTSRGGRHCLTCMRNNDRKRKARIRAERGPLFRVLRPEADGPWTVLGTVAHRIYELRVRNALTLHDMSREIERVTGRKVDVPYLSCLERGIAANPSDAILSRIAGAFGLVNFWSDQTTDETEAA